MLREKQLDLKAVKCNLERERIVLKENELQQELKLKRMEGQEKESERATSITSSEFPCSPSNKKNQVFDISKH